MLPVTLPPVGVLYPLAHAAVHARPAVVPAPHPLIA